MSSKKQTFAFFLALFFIFLFITYKMLSPFIGALVFAGILGGSFYNFNLNIADKLKISKNFASILTCLIILLIVIAPTVYIIYKLSEESIHLYGVIRDALNENEVKDFLFGSGSFATFLRTTLAKFNITLNMQQLQLKVLTYSQSAISYVINHLNSVLSNIFSLLVNFGIMMVALFAILSEGDKLKNFFFNLSPMSQDDHELILSKFNQMNYVSLYTNGLGGVIQGLAAGLALGIAGISSIFFWTTLMIILAFIPIIGISPITIPAVIYLWLKGQTVTAILVFVFCAGVTFWTENIFKPKFIGARLKVNSLVMMLFIFGGLSNFGIAGIFYGPIICIMLLTLIDLYIQKYKTYLHD